MLIFLAPLVHFQNLYNKTFQWSDIPAGASAVSLYPNVTVSKGQRLALFVTGITNPAAGLSPAGYYCYLNNAAAALFNVNTSMMTLFYNEIGDVSLKGINGNLPPIQATSRELSWWSIIK